MYDINKLQLYIVILSVFGIFSCKPRAEKDEINWTKVYRDSVFLSIPVGDLDELFSVGQVDQNIYFQAVGRIKKGLTIKNDTLYLNIKNGAEVKISENLYAYFQKRIMSDNRKLKTNPDYEIRQSLLDGSYFVTRKDTR